jgi:transposase
LGPALSIKAIHGGTAKNDTIDAQKLAVWRRGGLLPQAYGYPAARRATRDLLRRRWHLTRPRAALLPHVPQTNGQYNLPELGQQIASTANRSGVAARLPDPAVHKRVEVELALIDFYDPLRRDVALTIVQTATPHAAQTVYRRPSVPGIGKMLSLVLRYEMHDLTRFPRVQAVVSSCRLGPWAQASAGKRDGSAGPKMGQADLPWAFSAAAVLCLRTHPAGQTLLARFEQQPGKGTALTLSAQPLARAVAERLKRDVVGDLAILLQRSRRGVGEPAASLGHEGRAWQPCAAMLHLVRQRTPMST